MNRKLRENFATKEATGPSAKGGSMPVPSIHNCPYDGANPSHPTSGPRCQPGSNLGGKKISHPGNGMKA